MAETLVTKQKSRETARPTSRHRLFSFSRVLNFKVVIADKAFDSKAIFDFVESKNGKVVIPSQRSRAVQRQIDQEQYRERNLIERFFCKAKEVRRLATRYEKLLERFASFILIVAGMLWA